MRILMIHDDIKAKGGASIYVNSISKELRKLKNEIKIISYPKKFLNFKNNSIFFNKELFLYFRKEINGFKPDIIHINNVHKFQNSVYLACFLYSKIHKCKVIKTFHDYLILFPYNDLYYFSKEFILNEYFSKNITYGKFIERKLLCNFVLISPSEELSLFLLDYGLKSKFVHHPNFLNNVGLNKNKFSKDILYVGKLDKFKGIKNLIKSFKFLPENYKLTIVGSGDYESHLREISKKDKRIKFVGWKNNEEIINYYKNSSLVVVPSIIPEVGPIVAIEAMTFGKPVVGSNVPGIREIVLNNKFGLLFEPRNEQDLANKINQIFTNKELYNKFSKNTFKNARKYNFKNYIKKLIKIYSS